MKFLLLILLILVIALVYSWPDLKVGGWQDVENAFIILYKDVGQILLVKHKAIGNKPEEWHLPGGIIDPTDKTPLHAALREFHEEAEYKLTNYKVLTAFDYNGKSASLTNPEHWSNSQGDGAARIFVLSTTDDIQNATLKVDNKEMNERKWFGWLEIFIGLNPDDDHYKEDYPIKMRNVAWNSFHAIMKTEIFDYLDEHHNLENWKPLCSYGSNCYRKNPAHFEEYRHE